MFFSLGQIVWQVDEIERASALLEVDGTVSKVISNFQALGQNCRKMNDELGEKRLSSGISIARRNLKELENQITYYDDLPGKVYHTGQLVAVWHSSSF